MTELAVQGGAARGSFRAALAHDAFRALLASHAASQVGQSLFTVAVTVVIWDQTRSTAWVAAAASSRLLPYVLFSTLAGVVADRYDRRALLQAAHAARTACMAALVISVLIDASALVVLILTFVATLAGTPCYPAVAALIPRTVGARDLAAANALFTTFESTAFVAGPALGGVLLVMGPPWLVFAANAAVFALALALLRPLRVSADTAPPAAGEPFLRQFAEGFRVIVSSTDVAIPLLLTLVMDFVYGLSLVALLLVATDLLTVGAEGFGFLNAALGAGAFAAVVVSNRVAGSGAPLRVLAWAVLASSVPFAVLAIVDWLPAAMTLLFIAGAGGVLTEVIAMTILQRCLDDRVLARVFGILDATAIASILLGSALVPPLMRLVGLRWTLVIGGALVPVLALVVAPRLRLLSRTARERRRQLAPSVRLLAGLPVLRHAPRPVLEGMAAAMPLESYGAGTTIITQGDAPDDFYAVVSGRLGVYNINPLTQTQINELGPGDGFGEIGLLEHVPRTATVRTLEPVTLYRIAGSQLVAAVNSAPSVAGSAPAGGLIGRLARTVSRREHA